MCQLGQRQLALGRNKCGQKGEVVAFPRRLQPPVSSSAGLQRSFLGHPLRPALVPRQLLTVSVKRLSWSNGTQLLELEMPCFIMFQWYTACGDCGSLN